MAKQPKYYNPERIGTLFYPDTLTISKQAETADLRTAEEDKKKLLLILVDMQIDFCHEQGTLYVPGALDDIKNVIEFIFKNADKITHITASQDSHYPFQIFHPPWWVDQNGEHPEPNTIIKAKDVKEGKWRPLFKEDWSYEYVEKLQQKAKKELLIWPYHVLIAGPGNTLDGELWSAIFWHSVARKTQPTWLRKGSIPETEHYSMLRPEIEIDDKPQGTLNENFVNDIKNYDLVYLAGEAASHCVLETLEDMVDLFKDQKDQLQKIHVLKDCTSPVQHPDVDFHKIAQERFAEFAKQGINFVDSTDSLAG
jgi:nicotinamidase-related amidase